MKKAGTCGGDVQVLRIDRETHVLAVEVAGSGPPDFVCLHGLADTRAIWHVLAPALAEHGRVVLVDQRGHGESTAPPGPYRRDDLAADVRGVLDHLGIARAILVGHSFGGVVAMATALAYPERVAALCLLGTASQCNARAAEWYEKIASAAEGGGLDALGRAIYGGAPTRRIAGDARGIAHATRSLKSLADDPLTPKLPQLACPVLLAVGEKDPMGVGASVIMQRALPDATLEVIPGKGHWLHVEAADVLIAALERFLARVPAGI